MPTKRKQPPTIWELCSTCADQMYGGERCLVHNPAPELRELLCIIIVYRVLATGEVPTIAEVAEYAGRVS